MKDILKKTFLLGLGAASLTKNQAEKTIKENKPVMVIEQKPGNAERYDTGQTDASDLLQSWGMVVKKNMANDHILAW